MSVCDRSHDDRDRYGTRLYFHVDPGFGRLFFVATYVESVEKKAKINGLPLDFVL